MLNQLPGSPLRKIVDQALITKSYLDLGEDAMSLFRLTSLLVDIQLRHKQNKLDASDKLPGRHLPVDFSLEVDQREDIGNEHKN